MMMAVPKPVCELDDTWEDAFDAFQASLSKESAWSCHCLPALDKEFILSAPEIMDPKTDSGFGCEQICSLEHLFESGEIPAASSLASDAELLDVMDFIHVKELTYLQGYSLVQSYLPFPYFLQMSRLRGENDALYAYCRGVLRCLDCILRAVFATTIRSEEEFMLPPPELDGQVECSVDEILAELETAAARATPAVAARLRWRKHFLSALTLFLEAKRRSDVEAACDLCQDAAALLTGDYYQREKEPVIDPRLFREEEAPFWVSVVTPTKPLPSLPFVEAMKAYTTLLEQLASLRHLMSASSLSSVVDFVEQLGAQRPLLPMRCLAVVVIFSRDPTESFLYGVPLHQRLLEMVATEYGAPLYLRIFERDESSIESVVKYRIHRTMDPIKVTPHQVLYLREQTTDAVRRWAADASKHFLVHLETMLCNRGLAHRRLMNSMLNLAQFQEFSYSTDISVFTALQPGTTADVEAECIRCSTVLMLVANSFVLRAMELIVQFQVELDLLTVGELVPALWYLNFAQRVQTENITMLFLQNRPFIPETRINKKTRVPLFNLALTTRTTGVADVARVSMLEASRLLSDALFCCACLMESKGLIDLSSAPKHSLISVENVFNHRMLKCFGHLRSPPLAPYQRCISAKLNLSDDQGSIPVYARKAIEVAIAAAEQAKALQTSTAIEAGRRAILRPYLESFTKTARAVVASLTVFVSACEDEELLKKHEVVIERVGGQHLLSFAMHRKSST